MADSWNQEHERNGDASSSDDDSFSLLRDLDVWQTRGAPDEEERNDPDPRAGNKKQKREVEAGMPSYVQPAASCSGPTSQSGVPKCVTSVKRTHLHRRDGMGETYLHKACKRKDLGRVAALIQAGICVNAEDYAGWTALHEAAAAGDEPVVEELLRAGANVNARSCEGVTPLHDAVCGGHYQVAKLLLQHGSNTDDRNVGGLSALDMASEENIRELLSTFRASSEMHEHRRQGATSSEAHCRTRLPCPASGDTANVRSGESGDREGAREPGDIQPRQTDSAADNRRRSEATAVVLEEVARNQTEMGIWPLIGPQDAGRYHGALTQIHSVLSEVLARQRVEKDSLALKCRSVPDSLRRRVLKSRLGSLAACQRNLVELLQKQMHLVEVYVTTAAKLSIRPPSHQAGRDLRRQPALLSTQASCGPREALSCSQREETGRPVTSAAPTGAKDLPVPRPAPPSRRGRKRGRKPKRSRAPSKRGAPQPGRALQSVHFETKGRNPLIQARAEDGGRRVLELVHRGVVPLGSVLRVLLKGHWYVVRVQADGSLKDSRCKLHPSPERWLESIFGNNIPVSSAYAWDKVMCGDKPLSYYLLSAEAGGNAARAQPEEGAAASRTPLTTDAASLNPVMKIRIIHLVGDEELQPNAVMDLYWDRLLEEDCSQPGDWGGGLS